MRHNVSACFDSLELLHDYIDIYLLDAIKWYILSQADKNIATFCIIAKKCMTPQLLIMMSDRYPREANFLIQHNHLVFDIAAYCNLECIKYMHKISNVWNDVRLYQNALMHNNIETLKYIHESGCPYESWTSIDAAERGHIGSLIFLHENGLPLYRDIAYHLVSNKYVDENLIIACLKYIVEIGHELNEIVCTTLAGQGRLKILQEVRKLGGKWDKTTCSNAAENGQLEVLQWAHENGCDWDEDTCSFAAYCGHVGCLKYAVNNGCPHTYKTCEYATEYALQSGILDCLKYLHDNNCKYNKNILLALCNSSYGLSNLFKVDCRYYIETYM